MFPLSRWSRGLPQLGTGRFPYLGLRAVSFEVDAWLLFSGFWEPGPQGPRTPACTKQSPLRSWHILPARSMQLIKAFYRSTPTEVVACRLAAALNEDLRTQVSRYLRNVFVHTNLHPDAPNHSPKQTLHAKSPSIAHQTRVRIANAMNTEFSRGFLTLNCLVDSDSLEELAQLAFGLPWPGTANPKNGRNSQHSRDRGNDVRATGDMRTSLDDSLGCFLWIVEGVWGHYHCG